MAENQVVYPSDHALLWMIAQAVQSGEVTLPDQLDTWVYAWWTDHADEG